MVAYRRSDEKRMKWVNQCIRFGMKALAVLTMGFALTAAADDELTRFLAEFRVPLGRPVNLGEWNGDLDACKALADKEGIPMIAIWSNQGCGHCKVLERALMADTFNNWAKTSGMILCFTCSLDPKAVKQKGTYYYFCKGPQKLTNYPFVRFYWYQNGKKIIDYSIHGDKVDKQQGIKNGTYNYAGQIVVDYIMNTSGFGAYEPRSLATGGSFALSNTTGSHLEVLGTASGSSSQPRLATVSAPEVSIPLSRTNNYDVVATNYIQVAGGGKQRMVWPVNEKSKWVSVNVPTTAKVGDKVAVYLYDYKGEKVLGTNHIWVVSEPANAPANPYYIGEKTKDTLNFGEWTMDLDVAKSKVAAASGDAYTLVVFSGPLWCPDCKGAEAMFTSTEFKTWATSHQVALVHIDQGRTNALDGVPTLLSYAEYQGGTANAVSGAAYLSRKKVTEAAAQTVFSRNYTLSNKTYTRPWMAARNPNPHAVLLRKDGTIAGRWKGLEDQPARTFAWSKNKQRFDDLLLLADGGNEKTAHAYTTDLTYAVSATATTSLQINENTRVYKLAGDLTGKRVNFTASSDKVTISVLEGADPTNFTQNVLATGVKTVTYDFTSSSSDRFVQLEAYADSTNKTFTATTKFDTTLTSSVIIVPQEASSTYDIPAGDTTVTVEVVKGQQYRLDGFGDVSGSFSGPDAKGLYTATKGGQIVLPVTAATVTYQLWKPGTIAFADAQGEILEVEESGFIFLTRTGGSSGAVSATVTLTEADCPRVKEWSDQVVEWADGEAGNKEVRFSVVNNDVYEGETNVTFTVAITSGETPVGTPASMVMTIRDRDEPTTSPTAFGESFIKGFTVSQSYPVYNVHNPKRITIKRAEGSLPSGLTMKYDSATQSIILSGIPKSVGEFPVSYLITESRDDGKHTTTDPITWEIEVKDPSDINPYMGTAWTRTVPVSSSDGYLAGLLTVTATKSNKVTAKFQGTESKTYSFSGGWNTLDEETGVITSEIATRTGAKLTFSLGADGACVATLEGVGSYFEGLTASCTLAGTNEDFTPYKGYYTVQLPVEAGGDIANGTGYLTLTFTSASAIKSGRVSYAGLLPNGQSISGTSMLAVQDCAVSLPIFQRSTYDTIGLQLAIAPNAATGYTEDNRVIIADGTYEPYWLYRNTGASITAFSVLGVYGGYYASNDMIADCCADTYGEGKEIALIANTTMEDVYRYGTVTAATLAYVSASENKISLVERSRQTTLSFNKRTGAFSGVVTLMTDVGTIRANYKGILLPRWYSCDACGEGGEGDMNRPFGAGTIYFTDSVNGRSVKRGVPIAIDAVNL